MKCNTNTNINMASSESCEEERAFEDFLKYAFGFTQVATMRCAVELGIPDIVENHTDGVTLADLSSEVGCSPELLGRIMGLLTHHRIFKHVMKTDCQDTPTIAYTRTTLSHLLMKNKMAPFFMLRSSPEVIASDLSLRKYLQSKNNDVGPFEVANGMNLWQYNAANPGFGELFNKGMACHAAVTLPMLIENYKAAFEGIGCLVDDGGGNGTTLHLLVKACPWIIRAINFDLPHVVSPLANEGCVEHVAGDMFETIPTADSALLMWILHDWDDESCIKILENCKKAILKKAGKVIIVDVVVDDDNHLNLNEGGNNNKYRDFHLALDIEMMALTIKGKERTSQEWAQVLTAAGFTKHTINHISGSPQSVIEAYP